MFEANRRSINHLARSSSGWCQIHKSIFTSVKEWGAAPPRIVRLPVHCLLKPHTGCVSAGETGPSGWGVLLQPVINQTTVAGGIIVPCLALRAARLISPGETQVSVNIPKHNAGRTSEKARGSSVSTAAAAGCREKRGSRQQNGEI